MLNNLNGLGKVCHAHFPVQFTPQKVMSMSSTVLSGSRPQGWSRMEVCSRCEKHSCQSSCSCSCAFRNIIKAECVITNRLGLQVPQTAGKILKDDVSQGWVSKALCDLRHPSTFTLEICETVTEYYISYEMDENVPHDIQVIIPAPPSPPPHFCHLTTR